MQALIPYALGFMAMICYASLPVIAKKMHLDTPPFAFITVTMILLAAFARSV